MSESTGAVDDNERLLIGAGFAFGVMTTLLVLEFVLIADGSVTVGELFTSTDALIVVAGILFAAIVGIGLFVLSFPENRGQIPIAADDQE